MTPKNSAMDPKKPGKEEENCPKKKKSVQKIIPTIKATTWFLAKDEANNPIAPYIKLMLVRAAMTPTAPPQSIPDFDAVNATKNV